MAIHDKGTEVVSGIKLTEIIGQGDGSWWQRRKDWKGAFRVGQKDNKVSKATDAWIDDAIVIAELNGRRGGGRLGFGVKCKVNPSRHGGDNEVDLVFLVFVDEELEPLGSGGELSEIVSELEDIWNVQRVGDCSSGVDHDDVVIDDNFARIGDADLWVFKLNASVRNPDSVIAHFDVDIYTGFERRVDFHPFSIGIGVAIHHEGGGVVAGREFAEREAQGHLIGGANCRIGDGARGSFEDEAVADAVNVALHDEVGSGKGNLSDSGGETILSLIYT